METKRIRPSGGRFTEWTNGKPIVASDVIAPPPSSASDRRVITAPIPEPAAGQAPAPSAPTAQAPGQETRDGDPGASPVGDRRVITAPFAIRAPGSEPAPLGSSPTPTPPESRPTAQTSIGHAALSPVGPPSPAAGDRRVITAPLPLLSPAAPVAESASTQPGPFTEAARAPSPPPSEPSSSSTGPTRPTAKIKKHEVIDGLLSKLSYDRPYLVEEVAETSGHPAAAYAAPPRVLSPGLGALPREPRTKLTDSLVEEIGSRKARVASEAVAREVPTVVTRSVPANRVAEEIEPPAEIAGVPRRRNGIVFIGGGVALLFVTVVVGLALRYRNATTESDVSASHSSTPPSQRTVTDPTALIPPPPTDTAATSSAAAVEGQSAPMRAEGEHADAVASPQRSVTAQPTTKASSSAELPATNSPPPVRSTLRIQN